MFEAQVTVEWGDCDPAGIVFYPNYFRWMDAAFQAWLRALDLSQGVLTARFGVVTPLVDVGASFRSPARPGDALTVTAAIDEWQQSRFRVRYSFSQDERLIAEGHELRAWAMTDAGGRLRGLPIDEAFRELFHQKR